MGKEQYIREMWAYYCRERLRVKKFREDAEKETQAGIQGQWQHEPPAREYLEQVKCCNLYSHNDETWLSCVEKRSVGRIQKHFQSSSESHGRNNWWCAKCGDKYDWNKKAKVVTGPMSSKAHAVRHGLCGNLINVLKLLANQQ